MSDGEATCSTGAGSSACTTVESNPGNDEIILQSIVGYSRGMSEGEARALSMDKDKQENDNRVLSTTLSLGAAEQLIIDCENQTVVKSTGDATLAWLKVLGSVEGQDAFNPLKGSIAGRLDSDLTKYNVYGQSAAADWSSDTVVGSMHHGAVANEVFMNGFASVMEIFLNTRDAAATSAAAQELCVTAGICSE